MSIKKSILDQLQAIVLAKRISNLVQTSRMPPIKQNIIQLSYTLGNTFIPLETMSMFAF